MSERAAVYPNYEFPSEGRDRLKWPWAIPCAVLCLGFVAWRLCTRPPSSAAVLARIRKALTAVRGAEITTWIINDGRGFQREKRYFERTAGGRAGIWRIECADGDVRIEDGDGVYEKMPGQTKAAFYSARNAYPYTEPGRFLFENFDPWDTSEFGPWEVDRTSQSDGKTYFRLTAPISASKLRATCLVDATTFLPVTVEMQQRADPQVSWRTVGTERAKYGEVSLPLFDVNSLSRSGIVREPNGPAALQPRLQPGNQVPARVASRNIESYLNMRGDLYLISYGLGDFDITDQSGRPYAVIYIANNLVEQKGPAVFLCTPIGSPVIGPNRTFTIVFADPFGASQRLELKETPQKGLAPLYPDATEFYPKNLAEVQEDEDLAVESYFKRILTLTRTNSLAPKRSEIDILHRMLDRIGRFIPLIESDPRPLDIDRLDSVSAAFAEQGDILFQLGMLPGSQEAYYFAGVNGTGFQTNGGTVQGFATPVQGGMPGAKSPSRRSTNAVRQTRARPALGYSRRVRS